MATDVDRERLREHVAVLADWIRPYGSAELERAREYVAHHLAEAGWEVQPHVFTAEVESVATLTGTNLVARHARWREAGLPRFCVGAHFDSVPGSPGADDNASAVAVLLELARVLHDDPPESPRLEPELVGFDLEESGMLGGAEHARLCRDEGVDLRGMVSLEMLGYRDPAPGAQSLPRALVGQYPDTGDFIAVIGNQNSGELIDRFRAGMERVAELPVESLQVPENGNLLQATRLSDHSPFWDEGFSALMITDTSFLRNPHYHTPNDTADTLDHDFLFAVARGTLQAVRHVLETGLAEPGTPAG